jgi:hypothetical protein
MQKNDNESLSFLYLNVSSYENDQTTKESSAWFCFG